MSIVDSGPPVPPELGLAAAEPQDWVEALTSAGFLAALIPEEYGGSGLTMPAAAASSSCRAGVRSASALRPRPLSRQRLRLPSTRATRRCW